MGEAGGQKRKYMQTVSPRPKLPETAVAEVMGQAQESGLVQVDIELIVYRPSPLEPQVCSAMPQVAHDFC